MDSETRSVIEQYQEDVYHGRDLTLVRELLADPMFRYDAGGGVTEMSGSDCERRIGGFLSQCPEIRFRTLHLLVDGAFASWTYELWRTSDDGNASVKSGLEVFEVRNGKIVAVWNAPYSEGPWAAVVH